MLWVFESFRLSNHLYVVLSSVWVAWISLGCFFLRLQLELYAEPLVFVGTLNKLKSLQPGDRGRDPRSAVDAGAVFLHRRSRDVPGLHSYNDSEDSSSPPCPLAELSCRGTG